MAKQNPFFFPLDYKASVGMMINNSFKPQIIKTKL